MYYNRSSTQYRSSCGTTANVSWMLIIGLYVIGIHQQQSVAFIITVTNAAYWIQMPGNKQRRSTASLQESFRPSAAPQQLFYSTKDTGSSSNRKRQCRLNLSMIVGGNNDDTDAVTSKDEYAYIENVRESIKELSDIDNIDYIKEWDDSIKIISTLIESSSIDGHHTNDISIKQIESCLAEAWNWKRYAIITSPIARKFIKTIKPNSAMILKSVQWLQDEVLQLPNEIIIQGILECPETYLIRPQQSYEMALQVAPKPYWNDAMKFRELLLQYPSTLQYTYNCVDTGCKSECGNCWISFQYQISEQQQQQPLPTSFL